MPINWALCCFQSKESKLSKLNHTRPYLKYIDNLKREYSKNSALYKPDLKTISPSMSQNNQKTVRKTFWNKMENINLNENELRLIFEIFEFANKYHDFFVKKLTISLSSTKNKAKKIAALEVESENTYKILLSLAKKLIAFEYQAQIKGRVNGVFDWLDLLGPKILREGGKDFWSLINEHILKEAFENIEAQIAEKLAQHNKAIKQD